MHATPISPRLHTMPRDMIISLPQRKTPSAALILTLLGVGVLCVATVVHAQAPTPTPQAPALSSNPPAPTLPPVSQSPAPTNLDFSDASRFFRLPDVFVTNVTVASVSVDAVQGTFTIENKDKTLQSDLRYQTQLLGTLPPAQPGTLQPDTAPIYDRVVSAEGVSLLPGQMKTLPFRYQAPKVPEGDYRLRIRLITSQGRALGWFDAPVHLGSPGAPFAVLETGPIGLPNGTTASPIEGPNVAAGSSLRVQGIAKNLGKDPLTVTPHLTIYRWDITGEQVQEQSLEPVTLPPDQQTPIDVPVTAPATPDAYHAVVTLRDSQRATVSSQAAYRFVVAGASAKVVTAAFQEFAIAKGAQAIAAAAVVGPADREATIEGTVTVALLDGETVVTEQQTPVTLDAGVRTVTATFTLPRDIHAPGLRVTLHDVNGTVLDVYETRPNLSPDELQKITASPARAFPGSRRVLLGVLAGVLVLLVLALLFISRVRRTPKPPLSTMMTLLVAGIALGIFFSRPVEANGILVAGYDAPQIVFFINSPLHGGTYPGGTVPVNFDVHWGACDNGFQIGHVTIRHDATGQFQTAGLAAPIDDLQYEWTFTCPWAYLCYYPINGVYGSFNVPTSLSQTTVQFHGYWRRGQYANWEVWELWNLWVYTPTNNASCQGVSAPDTVVAGTSFSASVTTRNTGNTDWATDATPHRLGSERPRDTARWVIGRVSLPSSPVHPGEETTFTFTPTAPTTPGSHDFSWGMVEDGVEWFGPICEKKITVTSAPTPTPTPSLPDLTVTNVATSSNPTPVGVPVTLSGTVKNIGTKNAGKTSWTRLRVLDANSQAVHTKLQQTTDLAPNAIEVETSSWTPTLAGTYTLEVRADQFSGVTESNEGNNTLSTTFTVTAAAVAPACTPLTQTVSVNTNASLSGSGGNGTYTWTAPGGSPAFGAGVSFTTQYSTTGTKTVTVSSGGQNASCTVTVTTGSSSLPDLTVEGVTTSSNPTPVGQPVTLSGTVRNSGTQSAGSTSWTRLQVLDTSSQVVHNRFRQTADLAPNATEVETSSWTPTLPGTYTLVVTADQFGSITESNEGNNLGSSLFTVSAAAPPPGGGLPPGQFREVP